MRAVASLNWTFSDFNPTMSLGIQMTYIHSFNSSRYPYQLEWCRKHPLAFSSIYASMLYRCFKKRMRNTSRKKVKSRAILSSSPNNDMQWQHPTKQPRLFLVMLTMTSRKTPFLRGQLKNQRLNLFLYIVLRLLVYLPTRSVAYFEILSGSLLKLITLYLLYPHTFSKIDRKTFNK